MECLGLRSNELIPDSTEKTMMWAPKKMLLDSNGGAKFELTVDLSI
jgi:hypothetical protein